MLQEDDMKIEPVTKDMVNALASAVGGAIPAMVCGLGDVDLSRGRGVLDENGREHCLWNSEGKRITVTVCSDGGVIASLAKEIHPEDT